MTASDQLTVWIDDLRARLERGDLDGLMSFDVGDGSGYIAGHQTVRIMLADLDHVTAQLAGPHPPISATIRYRSLLDHFQRLRDLLGVHPTRNGSSTR